MWQAGEARRRRVARLSDRLGSAATAAAAWTGARPRLGAGQLRCPMAVVAAAAAPAVADGDRVRAA